MAAIRRLGQFVPSEYHPDIIEQEIRLLLPPCCQRERISVRVPDVRAEVPHPNNLQWHQDGGGSEGTTKHMIVWASEMPTEIRDGDEVFPSQPHDLVWFDNTVVFHRQPTGTDESRRWFVSIRCSGAPI